MNTLTLGAHVGDESLLGFRRGLVSDVDRNPHQWGTVPLVDASCPEVGAEITKGMTAMVGEDDTGY